MKKLFIFLLFLPLLALIFPVRVIGLEFDGHSCYYRLTSSSRIEVSYTHSVSLTKVIDVYEISGEGVYFTEERWQEFLAGQPIDFDYRDGQFYVKVYREYLGRSWKYWFIPVNNMTLYMDGDPVFKQPDREGIFEIRVENVPLILLIVGRC